MLLAFKFLSILLFTPLLLGHSRCLEGTSSLDLVKEKNYDLSGKTVVMTGGDSGIGSGISLTLAAADAKVILLGHNMEKTAQWMKHITHVTGNDKLSAIAINQFSLASVKSAADAVLAATDRIDVFVGDSGSDFEPGVFGFTTEDGYESDFELQYLSHFYLAELFLPTLRRSSGRVVYNSAAQSAPADLCPALGLPTGCLAVGGLDKAVRNPMSGVLMSYFMKAMHARHISITEKDVMAFTFNPGQVATPGLSSMLDVKGMRAFCAASPYTTCLCGVNVSCPLNDFQGAVSAVYLAAAPSQEVQPINGAFTAQCGWKSPGDDPFDGLMAETGYDGAVAYLQQFQALSWAWVTKTGVIGTATARTEVDGSLPKLVPVLLIGALLGFFVFWAKTRTLASRKHESEYMHLAGA